MSVQPGYEGFAALGDLVTGGVGRRAEGEYYKGVRESASAFKALEEARQERARSMAREALPDAVRNSGVAHPDLASALLGMATGQPNLGTVTSGLQDLGEMELARQQEEALRGGNIKLANQLRAVRADKNYEPVRSVDGNLIPSGVALGDSEFQVKPLPQTSAKIAVDAQRGAAAAEAQRAHAGVYRAQERAGGFRPANTNAKTHTLGDPPPVAPTSPSGETAGQAEVRKAREAIAAGVPRAAAVEHMRKKGFGHLADLLSKEGR